MQIKKFEALSMQEAVRLIKNEFGSGALILSTKKVRKSGSVFGLFSRPFIEVTAAVDYEAKNNSPGFPSLTPPSPSLPKRGIRGGVGDKGGSEKDISGETGNDNTSPRRAITMTHLGPLQEEISEIREDVRSLMKLCSAPGQDRDDEFLKEEISQISTMMARLTRETGGASLLHLHKNFMHLHRRLVTGNVDEQISARLIEAASKKIKKDEAEDKELIKERLGDILTRNINVTGPILNKEKERKLALFMGPTGVGKTTTIAKLAAHYAIKEKKRVRLITLDTYRIGAIEQLKIYAKIIGLSVDIAFSGRELADLVKVDDADLILIDTAGRSQRDRLQMSELREVFKYNIPIETYLILSATTKERDLSDIVESFKTLPVDRLIFTKLDETTTFGPLLNTMVKAKKPIAYLTAGQRVPEDIEVATSKKITELILGSKEA
ncbi:MAG TPA: flagellar biosynthesis protein FlhF [Nitrospiria bacterium]|nr:flagellar biosynthesis protein FlhF [Nitrospiria bacterium]